MEHMGIDHGRFYIRVIQQLLNHKERFHEGKVYCHPHFRFALEAYVPGPIDRAVAQG